MAHSQSPIRIKKKKTKPPNTTRNVSSSGPIKFLNHNSLINNLTERKNLQEYTFSFYTIKPIKFQPARYRYISKYPFHLKKKKKT